MPPRENFEKCDGHDFPPVALITERQRAEEALREVSLLTQQIIEGAGEGMVKLDRDLGPQASLIPRVRSASDKPDWQTDVSCVPPRLKQLPTARRSGPGDVP